MPDTWLKVLNENHNVSICVFVRLYRYVYIPLPPDGITRLTYNIP